MRRIEVINQLIEIGKISDAFSHAIKFASINGTYTKELKIIKTRYSIFKSQLNSGIINYGDNADFNKIITSFINILEEIEKDFEENNTWVKKEATFLNDVFFVFLEDIIKDELTTNSSFFSYDKNFAIFNLESKIDKEYWYILHWRFRILVSQGKMYIVKKHKAKELQVNPNFGSLMDVSNNMKSKLKNFFTLGIEEYGVPYFNIKNESLLSNDKIVFEFQFSSVIYPSNE